MSGQKIPFLTGKREILSKPVSQYKKYFLFNLLKGF